MGSRCMEIMGALIKRGYHVSSKTNHGVLDIYIVKPIMLEWLKK